MRKRQRWIIGAALCAGAVASTLPARAQTAAPVSETAVPQTSVPASAAIETLVPELTLGAVPGLVPSHVQGLSAELSPPPAPPKLEPTPTPAAGVEKPAEPAAAPPAATAVAAPPPSPDAVLAEQVMQSIRQSLGKPNGRDERSALASYYASATQPLWVGLKGLTPRAKALIAELKRADDWGLRAADFDVPQTAAAKPDAKPTDLADVEVKLGFAALKYARHARGGRVDPNAISDNLDRKAQLIPARDVVAGLAAASGTDGYLRKLHPQHPQFELLRIAYMAMRDGKAPVAVTPRVAEPEVKKDGKKKAAEAEAASARLAAQCSALDKAMFDPSSAAPELAQLPMSELARRRAKVAADLEAAEARWIEMAEALEQAAA